MDSFEDGHSWICFRFVDGRTEGSNAEGRRKAIGWIKTRPAIRRYSDHLLLALLKMRRAEKFKDRATVEHDIADRFADSDRRLSSRASRDARSNSSWPNAPRRLDADRR